jgi:hypothetical protein
MCLFDGQVEQLQLTFEGTTEKAQPDNQCLVTSERSRVMYWFENGIPVRRIFPSEQNLMALGNLERPARGEVFRR